MRKLLRQREVVEDDWQYLGEPLSGDTQSVIIPLAELRENAAKWRAWPGRLGVHLAPADRVETLLEDLARLALVAIEFPVPGDGRGYSQARLLRTRYRFTGELRAVGAVKRDQIFFMTRCGFDAFEFVTAEAALHANDALGFSVAYQPRGRLESASGS